MKKWGQIAFRNRPCPQNVKVKLVHFMLHICLLRSAVREFGQLISLCAVFMRIKERV